MGPSKSISDKTAGFLLLFATFSFKKKKLKIALEKKKNLERKPVQGSKNITSSYPLSSK